ncbi:AMP-binding protein, partial [Kitasatospora viridis]|uniref:AMP-binding protein n=1 Tax=Kitasatospora viridis TaxID=281105 RepID=UPI0031D4D726
ARTLADARPVLALTDDRWPYPELLGGLAVLEARDLAGPDTDPAARASAGDAAYLIHTSGSTGRPKGVAATHGGLAALLAAHRAGVMADRDRLRVALTASLCFDASWDGLLWLIAGHELHLIGDEVRRDATALVRHVGERGIDALEVTPSYAEQLVAEGLLDDPAPGLLLLGGEAVGQALWSRLRQAPATQAYNLYGPTEATVDTLVHPLAATDRPVLGRPVAGTHAYVLD